MFERIRARRFQREREREADEPRGGVATAEDERRFGRGDGLASSSCPLESKMLTGSVAHGNLRLGPRHRRSPGKCLFSFVRRWSTPSSWEI